MPRTSFTILMLLACAASMSGGQNTSPPANSPTLAETTKWIESRIVGISHASRKTTITYTVKKGKLPKESDRQIINTLESVSSAHFDGCSMTLEQITKGDDYTAMQTSTVPLGNLTKASLSVEQYDAHKTQSEEEAREETTVPASAVVITLEASSKVILFKRRSTGSVPLDLDSMPYEQTSSSLLIRSDDAAMPPRLVKAFNHAIQLCHVNEKPEPF